jgi:Transposase DDE domain
VTGHGRATQLLWVTVWKEELSEQRNDFEDACLLRLKQLVPPDCAVTILADRGFGDHKLFKFLDDLGFGYVIRFRGNIHVTDTAGETRPAADAADLRFGMGLGATRIGEPTRRDRPLLINAFAMVLLTMLGAAGESLGWTIA